MVQPLFSICSAFEAFVLLYQLKTHSTKQKFILFGGVVKDLNNICEIYHL